MEDSQLVSSYDELIDQNKPNSWGEQIQQAPKCIILMAHCQLLASRSSLIGLDISGYGLKYDTLFANIGYCTQMGQDTFRLTADRMETVARLAREMSKPGGIIESTLDHIHMKQSTVRDKRLQSYITSGLKMINESVEAISQVKNDFAQWKTTTETLVQVLRDKTSMIISQRNKDARELESRSSERETQERRLHDRRMVLRGLQARYNRIVGEYGTMFNNPETTMSSPGTFFASVLQTLMTPVTVLSIIGIWSVESTVTDLEARIDELNRKLELVQGEVTSLGGVLDLLKKTLIDLKMMQQQIENFMEFLIGIQKIIAIAKEGDDRVLIENLTTEYLDDLDNDEKLKTAYLNDASSMKDRFRIAAKAAGLYNEISDKFILPGLSWLGGLCFVDSSDETYEKSLLEIEDQENYLCDGAKQLITKRVEELGIELKVSSPKS